VIRRLWFSAAMLTVGTALLVAAGVAYPANRSDADVEARKGGTLRLSRHTDFDSVDPALAYHTQSWLLEFATCAKLFNHPDRPGAAGTRVIPEVVKTFTVSNDGRTYTFELKRTFRFHTGLPVIARSFVAAFNRDANPKMKSPAVDYMRDIVGADAVIAGKAKTISGVRVLGRYRLQIRLTKPLGDLTARLTMPFFCPILPNTPIDPAGIDNPPGSGPYYAERVVNRRTVLKRNPYYQGSRPANVDQFVFTVSESREACLLATEQNRIDHCVLFGIPETAYRRLATEHGVNRPGGRFFVSAQLDAWYFAFNHDRPAFRGPGQIPLKKAINYALDRPALARTFGYLGGRSDDQMLPPAIGRDERIYPLGGADRATARRWLARARFEPAKLVLYAFTDSPGVVVAAQVFASSLKQIGIEVEVKYFEQLTQVEKAGTRGEPFDVLLSGWSVDYADPASFFEPLLNGENIRQTGNRNFSYFDDLRVNARIKAANRLPLGAARRRAWADLDASLMRNNPPWAPYFHTTRANFVSRSFGCFLFHPVYGVDIAAACKK
jgi:ABC-type oligopeptide transport system substrate-binding subunit